MMRLEIPLFIYDGECTFCRLWIVRWKSLAKGRVKFLPFQQAASSFPEIPVEKFEKAAHLILPDGSVWRAAAAVFRLFTFTTGNRLAWRMYQMVPGFARVSEAAYRVVAAHRSIFYGATVLLYGKDTRPKTHFVTGKLFLKALGLVYLAAIVSFGIQIHGLIGSQGIAPVASFLAEVKERFSGDAYHLAPCLLWINSSDGALALIWISGCVLCGFLIAGVATRLMLAFLYLIYLSLLYAGQVFMTYQWDILLLEVGFLAIFLGWSGSVRWLLRWILFKFMVLSGAVKLLSGDPSWRDGSAMTYHYETQPLPNIVSWYAHQLPDGFHRFSTGAMFFIEIVVPFFIFLPRRVRMTGAFLILGLQVLILLTGNYNFFNLLTMVLCLLLFDDAAVARVLPRFARARLGRFRPTRGWTARVRKIAAVVISCLLFLISLNQLSWVFTRKTSKVLARLEDVVEPLQMVNTYGLFAVMTTKRPEIIVEGSVDGKAWMEYEFKYKPGDLKRPPAWAAPHQPRLDWQMWFAALGTYRTNPWFINFLVRLLEGSEPVLDLLAHNPFPDKPPKYVRATYYEYNFTTFEERRKDGAWWKRKYLGFYMPAVSLEDLK